MLKSRGCCQVVLKRLLSNVSRVAPFYLFRSPLVVNQSVELSRIISSKLQLAIYNHYFEKDYSPDGFERGAENALLLCALLIREGRFDEISRCMTSEAIDYVRKRVDVMPINQLRQQLSFTEDDIVKTVRHSCFFSSVFLLMRNVDNYALSFYATFLMFIDRTNNDRSRTINQLLQGPDDLLACNVTVGRLIPSGQWKVTDINFFNLAHFRQERRSRGLVAIV